MPERDDSGLKPEYPIQTPVNDRSRIVLPEAPRNIPEWPRDGKNRILPTLETRERDREVYRLKINHGLTWQAIADELGYADASGPWYAFKRVLDAIPKTVSEDARNHEVAHMEMLRARLLALMDEDYYTVQTGKVVFDPFKDMPLRDRMPVLQIIDRLVKIEERIAALQGLNNTAPAVVVSNVNYTIEGVDMGQLK